MKSLKTTALIALMTTAVGLSAIAPSYAQDAAPPAPPAAAEAGAPGAGPLAGPRHDGQRQGGPRGMAGFIGFERGAEAVEIALVRLSYAVDMTTEQQALFDTLRTDALAAAETFSAAVADLRPAQPAQPGFDIPQALDTRIAIGAAQLDALKSVQPALTAFFDSLTDEQKAELAPQSRGRGEHGRMGEHGGRGEHSRGDHRGHHQGRGAGPMGDTDDAVPAVPSKG